jgi:REP element-mobilizing transposase RayT
MSLTNLLFHVIFSTKDRRPGITPDIRERLYEYIGGVVRGEGGIQLAIGGVADHVHIPMKLRAAQSIADMLCKLKANSSRWLREQRPDQPGWQDEYAAFTVCESQVEAVRQYIANQEEHHRKQSFRDELIALLRKNRVEFDERYI